MAMAVSLLLVLAVAAVVLVGVVGLVLLIAGIARKRTPLWVCGLVAMLLAGLALLVGVPAVLFLCLYASPHPARGPVGLIRPGPAFEAAPDTGGCSIEHTDGGVRVRVAGVGISVIEPGGGGASASSTSGPREARHEIAVGNVRILVERREERLTLQVNGRDCGRIHPGDSVVITESREVLVNGQRRLP